MPMAAPHTAAINGFCRCVTARIKRNAGLSRWVGGACRKSTRSLPLVKQFGPPVTIITRTSSFSSAANNRSANRVYMALVSALSLSGRSMVSVSTPSFSSCLIRSVMKGACGFGLAATLSVRQTPQL
ncbi:hypothetical protein D3C87_1702450 [compost metagenome]